MRLPAVLDRHLILHHLPRPAPPLTRAPSNQPPRALPRRQTGRCAPRSVSSKHPRAPTPPSPAPMSTAAPLTRAPSNQPPRALSRRQTGRCEPRSVSSKLPRAPTPPSPAPISTAAPLTLSPPNQPPRALPRSQNNQLEKVQTNNAPDLPRAAAERGRLCIRCQVHSRTMDVSRLGSRPLLSNHARGAP